MARFYFSVQIPGLERSACTLRDKIIKSDIQFHGICWEYWIGTVRSKKETVSGDRNIVCKLVVLENCPRTEQSELACSSNIMSLSNNLFGFLMWYPLLNPAEPKKSSTLPEVNFRRRYKYYSTKIDLLLLNDHLEYRISLAPSVKISFRVYSSKKQK